MAPSHSRQLLVWTLPTIAAVLLSYLWYKKRRIGVPSDPPNNNNSIVVKQAEKSEPDQKNFTRSLSQPIDIPNKAKSSKSASVVISDEDLDLQIEKIKSMRYGGGTAAAAPPPPPNPNSLTDVKPKSLSFNKNQFTPITISSIKKEEIKEEPEKMAQKDVINNNNNNNNVVGIEEKFTNLSLSTSDKKKGKKKSMKTNRQNDNNEKNERDSANHSPEINVNTTSPTLSNISDNHSEGSSDSGKGGSDVATPPPPPPPPMLLNTACVVPAAAAAATTINIIVPTLYEFIIPQTLVGKLIGKHGTFVSLIKDKSNANIVVKKHPTNNKLKVCVIEGYQTEIDLALKLIRDKFPLKRFPDVTLEQVQFLPSQIPLLPQPALPMVSEQLMYLKLVEGINNDTIVSCMVQPNHLFLQQPTHPSFMNLNLLNNYMNLCYNEAESPLLPTVIPENTVCAAYSVGSWCRAMILSTDVESDTVYVKFLDYGGYAYLEKSKLRQIRGDFMSLPFQATECFLANVIPIGDNENSMWPEEAYDFVANITKGAILYTQVVDYTEDEIPLVYCYLIIGPQQIMFLNQELVNQGYAEWINYEQLESNNVENEEAVSV